MKQIKVILDEWQFSVGYP